MRYFKHGRVICLLHVNGSSGMEAVDITYLQKGFRSGCSLRMARRGISSLDTCYVISIE